jgi:hypothetical protein
VASLGARDKETIKRACARGPRSPRRRRRARGPADGNGEAVEAIVQERWRHSFHYSSVCRNEPLVCGEWSLVEVDCDFDLCYVTLICVARLHVVCMFEDLGGVHRTHVIFACRLPLRRNARATGAACWWFAGGDSDWGATSSAHPTSDPCGQVEVLA